VARIFLSHSSRDKEFVRRLATDLAEMGHTPWLDEQEIRAGDSIVAKVGEGVDASDYVVIVLSTHSVQSGWFAREWEAKLWQEISQGRTMVIPVLIEDCAIPTLLLPKRYADFRKSYMKGVVELMNAISPVIPGSPTDLRQLAATEPPFEITALLSKVQSRSTPLAQCLSDGMALALKLHDSELESFCRQELNGWDKKGVQPLSEVPAYRIVQMYVSPNEINMQSWCWDNIQSIFAFMRQHPEEFFPHKSSIRKSVPQLETQEIADSNKAMIHFQSTLGRISGSANTPNADTPVWVYGRADACRDVLEAIRQRFTQLLLDRLPRIGASSADT